MRKRDRKLNNTTNDSVEIHERFLHLASDNSDSSDTDTIVMPKIEQLTSQRWNIGVLFKYIISDLSK